MGTNPSSSGDARTPTLMGRFWKAFFSPELVFGFWMLLPREEPTAEKRAPAKWEWIIKVKFQTFLFSSGEDILGLGSFGRSSSKQ